MTRSPAATRLVLAELGADAEADPSAGLVVFARALRDAGAEVVHGGAMTSVGALVRVVEQEDPAALVLGLAQAGTEDPDPAALVAELVAALPGLAVYGLDARARRAGLPEPPADLGRAGDSTQT
ncbi:hypothetical protein SAMN05216266_108141 [Amycolatopsis marina]|uniref:B12-binding domain-containing protein n=1 Tax=Amycolatopsis marina TaxID=490629 RepID=A0A1I1A2Y4_9PSEU|nr:hypothetical protein [Amycolatopsis marina]SFB32311.1 hypothetical protein SAMN05216266_108141 [Amycolatopsis marina]